MFNCDQLDGRQKPASHQKKYCLDICGDYDGYLSSLNDFCCKSDGILTEFFHVCCCVQASNS
jgi:hypothetical protein